MKNTMLMAMRFRRVICVWSTTMSDHEDHFETWEDLDLQMEVIEQAGRPAIVYRWQEGHEHRAWVGGGTWRLTPVVMTQDEYERRIEAQWAADVADATAALLRL